MPSGAMVRLAAGKPDRNGSFSEGYASQVPTGRCLGVRDNCKRIHVDYCDIIKPI